MYENRLSQFLWGKKLREEDPKESTVFGVHDIIKQRFEQGAYHNLIQKLQLELRVASILETLVAVDTSPV